MSVTVVCVVCHQCVYRRCVVATVAGGCASDVGGCLSTGDVCLSAGDVLSWS
jgi:hypothetical protein